jgi:hypothetical protein
MEGAACLFKRHGRASNMVFLAVFRLLCGDGFQAKQWCVFCMDGSFKTATSFF